MLGNALRDVSKKSRESQYERDRRDWNTAVMIDCIEGCNMPRNCIFIFGCAKVGDQHVKNMWGEVEVRDQVPANQLKAKILAAPGGVKTHRTLFAPKFSRNE
jgi:hypothetical protein